MFQQNMFDTHHFVGMTQKTLETELGVLGDDENEGKSGTDIMESLSGDDLDPNQRPKKKPVRRHTQHQVQELKAFFNECPKPNDKQRKELASRLSLAPSQVKFWFQNKRTQWMAKCLGYENSLLKAENEKLRADNRMYREALSNATCPYCGNPPAIGEMPMFRQEHLMRGTPATSDFGTPEETWATADMEPGCIKFEETRNSEAEPVTSHSPPAL